MPKTWFSLYDFSFDYKGDEPGFIDVSAFSWARELESGYEEIKKELQAYLAHHQLISYFNPAMVNTQNSWKTISVKTWDIELYKVQKHFPFVCSLLKKYPTMVSASFSLLEPDSKIVPHCGDTNAIYRCHMGIDVPAGLPNCGIKVKGESKAWENGKCFAFIDAYQHEAWNQTEKPRYVLIVDVMREEFAHQQKYICATVRTSLFLQKRFSKLDKMPRFAKTAGKLIRPFMQMGLFMVNKLKVY